MPRLPLALLALALAATYATPALVVADRPHPRLIDFNPWAWISTNRNRSPAIMDYFFPPSRTPKQSSLEPPADRTPPKTTTSQTMPPTTVEDRSTTLARKVSNRTKSTVPATNPTATLPPKTKKTSHKTNPPTTTTEVKLTTIKSNPPTTTTDTKPTTVKNTQTTKSQGTKSTHATKTTQSAKTTQPPKTVTPTPKATTMPTTYRPTKHYTIRPVVRITETPSVEEDTETTSESDSTETDSDSNLETTGTTGTTAEGAKDTAMPTLSTASESRSTDAGTTTSAAMESTTETDTTAEPADSREGYLPLRDKPQPQQQTHVKINDQTKKETVPLPAGSTSVLAKPTKYHYYPHNQHIYLLPECAIQQVCNAVYVRLNYTQPLCACPARYRDPCSASLNADDLHTTRLTTDSKKKYAKKAVTLVKTCETVSEMRECRAPRDWSLLALQNIRTGKSHYLVICRCPENHILEGPMSHDQPTYASVPGIRVYGMMCVRPTTVYHTGYNANRYTNGVQSTTSAYKVDYSQPHSYPELQPKPVYNRFHSPSYIDSGFYNRRSRVARVRRMAPEYPPFPWHKVKELARSLHWIN